MGKFSGVLLASDFDDTLIAHDGSFPARNAAAKGKSSAILAVPVAALV